MIRSLFFFVAIVLAAPANAQEVVCKGSQGQPIYDPDLCKAIHVSREAFELNRQLVRKSEDARQTIDRKLKEYLDEIRNNRK